MKLDTEFYKLPLRLDIKRLEEEFQFSEQDWNEYPTKITGKAWIILVSVAGTLNDDFAISGAMQPTPFLERCPYLKQVMKALNAPISRSYLMRITGGTQTPAQADDNYHWFRRMAVHIPIVTNPAVQFFCNGKNVHMAAGEVWAFDNSQLHWMVNKTNQDCIHLIVETKGSSAFQSMLAQALQPYKSDGGDRQSDTIQVSDIPETVNDDGQILWEPDSFEVLTPQEIDNLTALILKDAENSSMQQSFQRLAQSMEEFRRLWKKAFSQFGHHRRGELAYQDLIARFDDDIAASGNKWQSQSVHGNNAIKVIRSMLLTSNRPLPNQSSKQLQLARKKLKAKLMVDKDFQTPEFEKPIFIISAPRAGSTLLFETLSQFPELWTIGDESHEIIEGIPELHPSAHNFSSNRLTEADALPHIRSSLRERFAKQLQDRDGRESLSLTPQERPQRVRFLEKTPKNALRIPFLKAVFPDALFIFLYREHTENISSLMEGWRSGKFPSYKPLPGWPYRQWCFLLTPGWSSLQESSLAEIAAEQWKIANTYILNDLKALPSTSWCIIRYCDLIQEPKKSINKIAQFAGVNWDEKVEQILFQSLPIARRTLSAPSRDKWRKNEREIARVLPTLEPIISVLEKANICQ
ncbi:sulfotransferase [Scytonema sp. NUACC26]|uniref:sulfotransferase n=1 Tax=Scytonema sp. NUACC26 TaxID=3140176 RepID=UPI0034DCBC3A